MDIDGTNPYANCKLVGDDHATGAGKSTGAMWIGGGTTVGFENFDAADNDVVALSPDGYIYEECVKDGGSGTPAFETQMEATRGDDRQRERSTSAGEQVPGQGADPTCSQAAAQAVAELK